MHINIFLGVCVAGLQLVAANVRQPRNAPGVRDKWVTSMRGYPGMPSNWGDQWGQHGGQHPGRNSPHKALHPDNDGKKHKHPKNKHHKYKQDDDDDKKHKQIKHKHHKGSKQSDDDNKEKHKHGKGHKIKGAHHKSDDDSGSDEKHAKDHKKHHKGKNDNSNSSKKENKGHKGGKKNKHGKNKDDDDKKHQGKHHAKDDAEGNDASSDGGSPAGYQGEVVQCHNVHRSNHSSPDIKWDDGLAATAAKISKLCDFQHMMTMDGGGYGQNIAAGVKSDGISHIISEQFYNNEIGKFGNQYGDEHPTGFHEWGHFTQLLWAKTDSVGCATAYCPNGVVNTPPHVPPYFTVCNYHPPGNVGGRYVENVGRPLGRPTIRGHGSKGKKGNA